MPRSALFGLQTHFRASAVVSAVLLAWLSPDLAAQSSSPAAGSPPHFELTLLQVPDGAFGAATALNEHGAIAGNVQPNPSGLYLIVHAAFWADGGAAPVTAAVPGLSVVQPSDIDSTGLVIGNSVTFLGGSFAFTWIPGQRLEPVPATDGVGCASAAGINERGVLVGIGGFPAGGLPARWIQGVPHALPLPPVDDFGVALAISESGLIVGSSGGPLTASLATRWFAGVVEHLQFSGALHSAALDVNDRGEAVGEATLSDVPTVGVRWRTTEGVALPTLGGRQSQARGINDRSWIVGAAELRTPTGSSPTMHAALWIGKDVHDLNALVVALPPGVVLVLAEDVNEAGQIVGEAEVGGAVRPFLLEPAGG
jgi:hypothetical protein